MNRMWSSYIQGTGTLYLSRKLRFHDHFSGQFQSNFKLDSQYKTKMRILEIGCGPGALAGALHRWYPEAEITGIDRDSEFIRFAIENEPGITFVEGDAMELPFGEESFDVTISNTVSEHIEPSKFYGEQYRILKPGGKCIVLSSRRGIHKRAECLLPSEEEKDFWKRVEAYDHRDEEFEICKYPVSEAELPAQMSKYGFQNITTGYVITDLTPDDPKYPDEMALEMIEAQRQSDLDAVRSVQNAFSENEAFAREDFERVQELINIRFDRRTELYQNQEKQWDTNTSVIMVVCGERR